MPMRIGEINYAAREVRATQETMPRSTVEAGQKTFERQLHETGREQYETNIRKLAEDVIKQGEKLGERADIKEFQRYRELVTDLIRETVSGSYEFHKSGSFDARGRHRIFVVVRKIHADIEEIASEILSGEANNLRILDKIDDIRGLIVDMLL